MRVRLSEAAQILGMNGQSAQSPREKEWLDAWRAAKQQPRGPFMPGETIKQSRPELKSAWSKWRMQRVS